MARISKVIKGKGKGKIFTKEQLRTYLNGVLLDIARMIKEFLIAEAEKGGRHKFRRDGKDGFVQSTKVDVTENGVIISLPEKAKDIELGRKAKAPKIPLDELIAWAKRYRIVGRDKATGKYVKASAFSVNNIALRIQESIYKNGIKARPFLEASLDYAEDLIEQVIDEVMIPEIFNIIEFSLKK